MRKSKWKNKSLSVFCAPYSKKFRNPRRQIIEFISPPDDE
jgi:hypothetical protein